VPNIVCNFSPVELLFAGAARLAIFGGPSGFLVFDDVTLGVKNAGPAPVPEPAMLALSALGVAGLVAPPQAPLISRVKRSRRRCSPAVNYARKRQRSHQPFPGQRAAAAVCIIYRNYVSFGSEQTCSQQSQLAYRSQQLAKPCLHRERLRITYWACTRRYATPDSSRTSSCRSSGYSRKTNQCSGCNPFASRKRFTRFFVWSHTY